MESLLLLLLLETLKKPITITITSQTITITITFTFIITAEPKKHNTSRLQSNIQRLFLLCSILKFSQMSTVVQVLLG